MVYTLMITNLCVDKIVIIYYLCFINITKESSGVIGLTDVPPEVTPNMFINER